MRSTHAVLSLFTCLALLVSNAPAQVVDADIRLGDRFEGTVDDSGAFPDVDILRFDAVAGTLLTVTVAAGKKQEILPQIEVFDILGDTSLITEASGKKKSAVKSLLLPTTGPYEIRISGSGDTIGDYKVRTKEKLGKEVTKILVSEETAAAATLEVTFDARPGLLLNASVKPDKKSEATVSEPTLDDPNASDDPVDLTDLSTQKKTGYVLKQVPLDTLGTYTLATDNDGADGAIRITAKLKREKFKKGLFREPEIVTGESAARSLSGSILASDTGAGLAGVLVTAGENGPSATTDANGNFVIFDPPVGDVDVRIDGTAALGAGVYKTLDVEADIAATGATIMPQSITLPDLNNADAALDNVAVDGAGTTTEELMATGNDPNIQLEAPIGTTITIDGAAAVGAVDINVTPVPANEIPMPLPGTLDPSSFVSINPTNSAFDAGGGTGIDIVLPNLRDFPIGTMVDVWSFDHDVGDWVNRSDETGNQGIVVDLGGGLTQIEADGVITEGGWHAPAVTVDATCATTLTGTVVDGDGTPIPGVSITTSYGNVALTDENGMYSIPSVPGYDALTLPACNAPPSAIDIDCITPVAYGAVRAGVSVAPGSVVAGGTTDVGETMIVIPTTGDLAGRVTDNGAGAPGTVTIEGPDQSSITSDTNGSFFSTGFSPGNYTAAFTFAGAEEATVVGFSIEPNRITTINLQRCVGEGGEDITVKVFTDDDYTWTPLVPASGAQVLLIGTDPASAGGVIATTNAQGEASFNSVDGPYTVTAQFDTVIPGPEAVRSAATIVGVSPQDGVISIPIEFESELGATLDATLEGTIANMPIVGIGEEVVLNVFGFDINGSEFNGFALVDGGGFYTMAIPSGATLHGTTLHRTIPDGVTTISNFTGILTTGMGPANPAQTLVVNMDFDGDDSFEFDQPVDLTYTNLEANQGERYMDLCIMDSTTSEELGFIGFFFFENDSPLPAQLMLPDATDTAFNGRRIGLLLCEEEDAGYELGEFFGSTPAAIDFLIPTIPTITAPTDQEFVSLAEAEMLEVTFDSGFTPGGNGIECFVVEDLDGTGLGFDFVQWFVYVEADTTTTSLPATAVPMFAEGLEYELCVEPERFTGYTLDFDTYFGDGLSQRLIDRVLATDSISQPFELIGFNVEQAP